MTKDEYGDFVLRYKGCGACFPMYHTLSRFEKMWFTAIQKDVAELEKEKCELLGIIQGKDKVIKDLEWQSLKVLKDNDNYQTDNDKLEEENAELKERCGILDKSLITSTKNNIERQEIIDELKKQLAQAKNIIKDYMIIVRGGNITICGVPEENRCINVLKFNEQAEQFLKETGE